jgi:hypothetical protein
MKTADGSASDIIASSTVYPSNARRRPSLSSSCPIDTHVSVWTAWAPATGRPGGRLLDRCRAEEEDPFELGIVGVEPRGQAYRTCMPSIAEISPSDRATLL